MDKESAMNTIFDAVLDKEKHQLLRATLTIRDILVRNGRSEDFINTMIDAIDPCLGAEIAYACLRGSSFIEKLANGDVLEFVVRDEASYQALRFKEYGFGKIELIKVMRELASIGLREAKDAADSIIDHGNWSVTISVIRPPLNAWQITRTVALLNQHGIELLLK